MLFFDNRPLSFDCARYFWSFAVESHHAFSPSTQSQLMLGSSLKARFLTANPNCFSSACVRSTVPIVLAIVISAGAASCAKAGNKTMHRTLLFSGGHIDATTYIP
jgi:hypothetical protein